ncbi:MAG: radical SAM protein [Nanoarchaeota archaeon]|nr:radical SAM protein [Nanoarchaeota archaeon]
MRKRVRDLINKKIPRGSTLKKSLEFLHRSSKIFTPSGIKEINLEFVSFCNLRCKWCTLDHSKKKEIMSEGLLHKFLNNLISDNRFRKVEFLYLWNGGEILLHPNLIGMLKIIKEYKEIAHNKRVYFPKIVLLTNGVLLDKKIARDILNLNVIDVMRFSIDGGSRETFEEIRRGAKWDMIFKNISNFQEMSHGRTKTDIICIIDYEKKLNTSWMSEEFRNLLNLVDTYELRYPHDFNGEQKLDISDKFRKMRYKYYGCYFLMHSLVILPNGDVTVCCADLNSKGVVGNLSEQDLYSIYRSPIRKKMIRCLLTGQKDKIPLCKNCIGH